MKLKPVSIDEEIRSRVSAVTSWSRTRKTPLRCHCSEWDEQWFVEGRWPYECEHCLMIICGGCMGPVADGKSRACSLKCIGACLIAESRNEPCFCCMSNRPTCIPTLDGECVTSKYKRQEEKLEAERKKRAQEKFEREQAILIQKERDKHVCDIDSIYPGWTDRALLDKTKVEIRNKWPRKKCKVCKNFCYASLKHKIKGGWK